ncbi:hypothetical protein [Bacillus tropicus]|uniref:hypothetical protein n=1 Tax=Bacillus tropicus TaxID=2026188 RepID=UPI001CFE6773|nr:hypothetical protein [Bacillus tropicus]
MFEIFIICFFFILLFFVISFRQKERKRISKLNTNGNEQNTPKYIKDIEHKLTNDIDTRLNRLEDLLIQENKQLTQKINTLEQKLEKVSPKNHNYTHKEYKVDYNEDIEIDSLNEKKIKNPIMNINDKELLDELAIKRSNKTRKSRNVNFG